MRKLSMKRIVTTLLLLTCTTINVQAADIATVNGKRINQSLLDFIIKNATDAGRKVDDDARANIIDKLVTNELLDQEALKTGIDKSTEFQASQELALHELRINAYLKNYIKTHPIDDKALQTEYDRQVALIKGKDYKASHILVKTEDEAKAIIKKLSEGADFAKLAHDESLDTGSKEKGGDVGWFSPDNMVKPFSDAVAKLKKGEYSRVATQTDYGWHVIRLEDVRDTEPPSFDAVKDELRDSLQKQQLEKLVTDLKATAKIKINAPDKK